MAHFAKIEDGIVTSVNVVTQEVVDTYDGTWVQTSYNTRDGVHYGQNGKADGGVALRFRYAGIGMVYDSINDVFYSPKPYASWTLNTSTWLWEAPLDYPSDATPFKVYDWEEGTYQADNTKGWVEK